AKMKELYLQKEEELKRGAADQNCLLADVKRLSSELDEAKSQLVVAGFRMESDLQDEKRKCQEEIASLQQIVQETVEESSSSRSKYDSEVKRLKRANERLETQNLELRSLLQQQQQGTTDKGERETPILAPGVMLSAVTKTLARKVVSQLGADASSLSQDNMEDSMRKAQEDAEVLRSLVIPLEEEIRALKEKLRYTDQQLRKYEVDAVSTPNIIANVCQTYECTICAMQKELKLSSRDCDSKKWDLAGVWSQVISFIYREDLTKEADFRKDMEEKWNEKKEEHKVQVAELKKKMETAEETLQELRHTYTQVYSEVMDQLTSLTQQREQVQEQLSKLQKENDNLLGKHSAHSQQLQNEMINWPDKVEDLQELLLKFHEELIAAKVAKETMEEQEQTLHCEIQLIRDQMSGEHEERVSMEDNLTQELNSLKIHLHKCERERDKYKVTYEGLEKLVKSSQQTATEFETQLTDVLKVKKQLEEQVAELKSRVGSLQQELDNSEAVQKDFVRLSQSLQVQLERIREADTQVRWQHDEDIEECQGCRTGFFFPRSKQHCRHCGRIFCINCLSHTVHSGPNQRPSKVCDVCHTLLVRDTAPYFSTEPPHTPD
ncbi:hypothetical protein L798_04283, partial [Zootermopsis nevadensis]